MEIASDESLRIWHIELRTPGSWYDMRVEDEGSMLKDINMELWNPVRQAVCMSV